MSVPHSIMEIDMDISGFRKPMKPSSILNDLKLELLAWYSLCNVNIIFSE